MVQINHEECLNCFRCISVCPVKYCNEASEECIVIHHELCIQCGKCIESCSHNARIIVDDFDDAFQDLQEKENSLVLFDAPINASFKNQTGALMKIMRNKGIQSISEIGCGHELVAKSYADYLRSVPQGSVVISSACPVIVNYIELYKPELIPYLAPVYSPIILALKTLFEAHPEYKDYSISYLSPCLARRKEFNNLLPKKVYNVTYRKIHSKLIENKIDLPDENEETPLEDFNGDFIAATSWLSTNVQKYIDGIEIKKIAGIHDIIRYLNSFNVSEISNGSTIFIDAISCKSGCEGGSGSTMCRENPDRLMSYTKKYISKINKLGVTPTPYYLAQYYDYERSKRHFTNRLNENWLKDPSKDEVAKIFIDMHKQSKNDVKNCTSCGYHECAKMAKAIFNNLNKADNCHFYLHKKLSFLAYYDKITNLPSRNAFYSNLEESIMLEQKLGFLNEKAIIFVDLEGFREINETLGSDVGDEVLIRTASRLKTVICEGDFLFRISSDEFAIILNSYKSPETFPMFIAQLQDLFSSSMFIEDNELYINASIGVSVYPADGDSALALIKNAEAALHEAKFTGKRFVQFTYDIHMRAIERLTIINSLRTALEHNEFEMYYQPQYTIDGVMLGAEALIRWNKPELGIVSPARFIPLAEESGLIIPIGEWVIEQVFSDFAKLCKLGLDLTLSANLSVRQFKDKDLVMKIEQLLRKYSVAPNKMHLEITESFILDNASEAIDKLNQLNRLGLKISLDDFGTGYSSLSYLHLLELDTLKIDKSFIDLILEANSDVPLVDTIVSMAMGLGLDLVAEGVSEKRHVDYLKKFGCDIVMQGFYFGRPMTFESFVKEAKVSSASGTAKYQ